MRCRDGVSVCLLESLSVCVGENGEQVRKVERDG